MINERLSLLNNLIKNCFCTQNQMFLPVEKAMSLFQLYLRNIDKGIVYVIGNGGSAGIASHFCADLLRTLNISASTLFDSSVMTCFSNDYGYDCVFEKQLNISLKKQDLLVVISSSGESENILKAVKVANQKNTRVITLSGFSKNNHLRSKGELNFYLNSYDYGLVEMGHFFLLHTIIDTWNKDTAVDSDPKNSEEQLSII